MIEVSEQLKNSLQSNNPKNLIFIHFPNGECDDITNDIIIKESLSLTESVCSKEILTPGLYESNVLEFEAFGIPNINGATIECKMGMIVEEVNAENSGDVVGFSLNSPFIGSLAIDVKANDKIYIKADKPIVRIVEEASDRTTRMKSTDVDNLLQYEYDVQFNKANRNSLTVYLVEAGHVEIVYKYNHTVYDTVNYGEFVVDSCKRNSSKNTRKVVAYSRTYSNYSTALDMILSHKISSNNSVYFYPFGVAISENAGLGRMNNFTYSEAIIDGNNYETENLIIDYKGNDLYLKIIRIAQHVTIIYPDMIYCEYDKISNDDTEFENYVNSAFLSVVDSFKLSGGGIGNSRNVNRIDYTNTFCIPMSHYDYSDYSIGVPYKIKYKDGTEFEFRNQENIKFYIAQPNFSVNIQPIEIKRKKLTEIDDTYGKITYYSAKDISVNSRGLFEQSLALIGMFAKTNRNGELEIFKLNEINTIVYDLLYPSNDLYPGDELYPIEKEYEGIKITKDMYSDFWYDDYTIKPITKVSCTYNDGTEDEAYMEIGDDTGRSVDLSDNDIIQNSIYSNFEMRVLLTTFLENVKDVKYIPYNLSLRGIPYVEAGDIISVETDTAVFTSYVLRRRIKGIQMLQDSYEAK